MYAARTSWIRRFLQLASKHRALSVLFSGAVLWRNRGLSSHRTGKTDFRKSCRSCFCKIVACRSRINPRAVFLAALFMTIGTYLSQESWTPVDAFYYTTAVVTTVGFGDLAPTSALSKCVTVVVLIMSVLGLATFAERLVGDAAQRAGARLLLGQVVDMKTWGYHDQQQRKKTAFNAVLTSILFCLVFICTVKATMGLGWFEALYFMTIMFSTVGLGDTVPNTIASKFCVSLGMLIGVPLLGYTLSTIVRYRGEARLHKVQELDDTVIDSLQDFCAYMRKNNVYKETPDQYDKIDKFEFLCWVLTRSHILEVQDLQVIMKNFRELDKSGDGELDTEDKEEKEERREGR